MPSVSIRTFCLVTLVLRNVHNSLEREIPRRSFLSRRAIDGTRGRKYFDPEEEGAFDSYGSAGGQYDPYEEKTDLSDIRKNVPGEPRTDYPAYTTLPQTGFTCEGRSRGYYADQVAGCQVFHVCHDVLVSSFLCPIGSIFSQKLLTCDWWTKVDCSSSDKYIDVNRNSYQQDDDEMIRNAYAMISLGSGTDVTKDGLVDPDTIGSVTDYQEPEGRRPGHASMFAAENDLRSNLEGYSNFQSHRDSLPRYRFESTKSETSQTYRERSYPRRKSQAPYQDSPIIRIQQFDERDYAINQQRKKYFQENYPRPNEFNFNNQFQPSYAPTVPTVTTTTRRFYSPTVPTTLRLHSTTVPYNKLDQRIDSSDYFFSHSRTHSFATPPSVLPKNNQSRQNLETPELIFLRRASNPREVHQFQYNYPIVNNIKLHRTLEEEAEDIEIKDSVGLGHALHQRFREMSAKEQNSVNDKSITRQSDSTRVGSSVLNESRRFPDPPETEIRSDYQHTLARPEFIAPIDETGKSEETTEQYQRSDKRGNNSGTSVLQTTPFFTEIEAKQTAAVDLNANESRKFELSDRKEIIDRMDFGSGVYKLSDVIKPFTETPKKFQIKVPDLSDVSNLLSRYSTLTTGPYPGMRTTELPPFRNTYPADYVQQPTFYDESLRDTRNYNSEDASRSFNSEDSEKYLDTDTKSETSSTNSWFPSSPFPFPSSLISLSPPSSDSTSQKGINPNTSVTADLDKKSSSILTTVDDGESLKNDETSSTKLKKTIRTEEELIPEVSTANSLFKSIRPETLKQIEETIENNFPYQVTVTVAKGGKPEASEGALFAKLNGQGDKVNSTFIGKSPDELDVTKSSDPESHASTNFPIRSTVSVLNTTNQSIDTNNFTAIIESRVPEKQSFDTELDLLQLMSELLKFDRVPRPFSLANARSDSFQSETTFKDANLNRRMQSVSEIPSVLSKEQILDRLTENFGNLHRTDIQHPFETSEKEKIHDFSRKDLDQGSSINKKVLTTTAVALPEVSTIEETATTITIPTPETTLTTEPTKTIVKTEFVPSIGFSFDTNEGREEYVEAVLGGLIEPESVDPKKEATALVVAEEGIYPRNGTSRIQNANEFHKSVS